MDTLLQNDGFVKMHRIKSANLEMFNNSEKVEYNFTSTGKLESRVVLKQLDTFEYDINKYSENGSQFEHKHFNRNLSEKYKITFKYMNGITIATKYDDKGGVAEIDSAISSGNNKITKQYLRIDSEFKLNEVKTTNATFDKSHRILKQRDINMRVGYNSDTTDLFCKYDNSGECIACTRYYSESHDTVYEKYSYEKNGDNTIKTTFRNSASSRPHEETEILNNKGLIVKRTSKEYSSDEHDNYTYTYNPPSVLVEVKREGRDGGIDFIYQTKIEYDKNNVPLKVEMIDNMEERDKYIISYTYFN